MCEFCRGEREISFGEGYSFFIVETTKGYKLNYLDDNKGEEIGFLISYCPICGRNLTDEEKVSLKDRIAKLNDRHQSDCITINQLNVTIDVLVEKLAKLREVHGL